MQCSINYRGCLQDYVNYSVDVILGISGYEWVRTHAVLLLSVRLSINIDVIVINPNSHPNFDL